MPPLTYTSPLQRGRELDCQSTCKSKERQRMITLKCEPGIFTELQVSKPAACEVVLIWIKMSCTGPPSCMSDERSEADLRCVDGCPSCPPSILGENERSCHPTFELTGFRSSRLSECWSRILMQDGVCYRERGFGSFQTPDDGIPSPSPVRTSIPATAPSWPRTRLRLSCHRRP